MQVGYGSLTHAACLTIKLGLCMSIVYDASCRAKCHARMRGVAEASDVAR